MHCYSQMPGFQDPFPGDAEDADAPVMPSDFDIAITRSVPLIDDFDDFDPALSPMKTSGCRSETRMRFNLDARELIHGLKGRSSPRTG
jgi:hypothetical protein